MPTLPWAASRPAPPTAPPTGRQTGPRTESAAAAADRPGTADAVVMASRFTLRTWRHVLPFFVDSMRIHRQVRRADGAYGVSLEAHPLRREFLTLSSWRDDAAIQALVRAEPHRSVMRRYRSAMKEATFRFWPAPADEPPDWADAKRRLAAPG